MMCYVLTCQTWCENVSQFPITSYRMYGKVEKLFPFGCFEFERIF